MKHVTRTINKAQIAMTQQAPFLDTYEVLDGQWVKLQDLVRFSLMSKMLRILYASSQIGPGAMRIMR